ncbi:hypothetical protein V6N13_095411 [Hibiscus sabdariffa]|uniref:Uncharacterized protein n=1 Tax=Hibiscus sabdariffa TaxID=183260 RepID=A0ABR2PRU1_9ROSI
MKHWHFPLDQATAEVRRDGGWSKGQAKTGRGAVSCREKVWAVDGKSVNCGINESAIMQHPLPFKAKLVVGSLFLCLRDVQCSAGQHIPFVLWPSTPLSSLICFLVLELSHHVLLRLTVQITKFII